MTGAEITLNVVSFLLTIFSIWLGIYFPLQQQKVDQEKKYEEIAFQLREMSRLLSDIKAQVGVVDRATTTHLERVLGTQEKVIMSLTTIRQIDTSKLPLNENLKEPNKHESQSPS